MISQNLLQNINRSYSKNLKNLSSSTHIKFNAKSSLHLLTEGTTKFVLKEIPKEYFALCTPEHYFKGLQHFMQHVMNENIPLVSYLTTNENTIYVKYNENYYVLYPFIEGSSFQSIIPEVQSMAKFHATLNRTLTTMAPTNVMHIKETRSIFLRRERLQVTLQEVRKKAKSATASMFRQRVQEVLPLVEQQIALVDKKQYPALPKIVANKDFWPGNVIYQKGEVSALLDPDEMMYIPHIRDVVYAMWCFSTRNAEGNIIPFNQERATHYIETYNQELPLTAQEKECIPIVAIRIWVEDLLNYSLNSDFIDELLPGLQRKITHLKNAIKTYQENGFPTI